MIYNEKIEIFERIAMNTCTFRLAYFLHYTLYKKHINIIENLVKTRILKNIKIKYKYKKEALLAWKTNNASKKIKMLPSMQRAISNLLHFFIIPLL